MIWTPKAKKGKCSPALPAVLDILINWNFSRALNQTQLDRNRNRNERGGGIMLIATDNLLTSRLDKYCSPDEIELFCIELNLRQKKMTNFLLLITLTSFF